MRGGKKAASGVRQVLTQCGLITKGAGDSRIASSTKVAHRLTEALRMHAARMHDARAEVRGKLAAASNPNLSPHALALLRAEAAQGREAVAELALQRAGFENQVGRLLVGTNSVTSDNRQAASKSTTSALYREAFRLAPFSVTVGSRTRTLTKPLPALALRNELEVAVRSGAKVIIVEGATGSGKSTQLPQCEM